MRTQRLIRVVPLLARLLLVPVCRYRTTAGYVTGIVALLLPIMRAEGDVRVSAQAQSGVDKQEAQAVAEFKKAYGLAAGENVKRVGPPFPASRAIYYRYAFSGAGKPNLEPSESLFFLWQQELKPWGSVGSPSLRHLLRVLMNIYPQEIEGDQQLLKSAFDGDFVVREGEAPDKLVTSLADVLRRDFKLPVKMTVREVERGAIVVNGGYRFTPTPGGKQDAIEIYEKNLSEDVFGGGTGDLKTFAQLGRHVYRPAAGRG